MKKELRRNNLPWGIITAFLLLFFSSSSAQTTHNWGGTASSDLLSPANWDVMPDLGSTSSTGSNLIIGPVSPPGHTPELLEGSAAAACRTLTLNAGAVLNTSADFTTSGNTNTIRGVLNVNKGTFSSRVYISSGGVINVNEGAVLQGVGVWRLASSSSAAESVININGGTFNFPGSGLTVGQSAKGTLNIKAGTVNYTSPTALNISASNGLITIDAGSLILNGDQTAAVAAWVSSNNIKAAGAALAAGKPISSKYDPATKTTKVIAGIFVNNSPVAAADSFSVALNGTASVLDGGKTSLLANDKDVENNALTAVLVSGPANGSLTLNPDGTFIYVHNGSNTTADSFTYKANDGNSDSNAATVTIAISHVPSPSGLEYPTPNQFLRGVYISPLKPSAGGGEVLSYSVSPALPQGLSINAVTGVISGTPRAVSAAKQFTVTAANLAGSATAKVSIAVNDSPGRSTARPMEYLDRGLVALGVENGVFLSWRMVGTDNPDVSFNIYKNGKKINETPISTSTNYVDPAGLESDLYKVEAILPSGKQMSAESAVWPFAPSITPDRPNVARLEIPIPAAPGPEYSAGDMSVGDLDGDGKYELIFLWESPHPENAYLEAIDLTGKSLWRISCGPNTTSNGIAFMVYDLDGDGKSEVACVTAPGTKDGLGNYLSTGPAATDDDSLIILRRSGHLMEDPAYMTVFNGFTGAEMATVDFPIPIGPLETHEQTWGDDYGKRAQSIKSAVLYDKDKGPLLVFCRGIYSRIGMGAYSWNGNDLKQEWIFDSDALPEPDKTKYRGEGNHGVTVGDVDGDGSDELMYGACAIDNTGKGLYATGRGHGDSHALGDLDPSRPGMEYFQPHENATYGVSFRDAATGEIIWEILSPADVGRAWAADVSADTPGFEISVVGDYIDNGKDDQSSVFDSKGNPLTDYYNSYYQPIYFDGDIQRELRNNTGIDDNKIGTRILTAWYYGAISIHSTKQDANLVADILGDWREEVIFLNNDKSSFLLFSTWIPTEHKVYTLMHDPAYRMQVATQNIGYNQPANLSYYLPNGSPKPDIMVTEAPDTQEPLIEQPLPQSFCYSESNSYTIPTLSANDNRGVQSISYAITGATARSGQGDDASGIFNAGVSTITWSVTDINNNQSSASSTVTVNAPLTADIADVYAAGQSGGDKNTLYVGYGPSSLTITAAPNGAAGPYAYKWSNGQDSASIAVSQAGTYSVEITDPSGCQATASININAVNVQCGSSGDKVMVCHNGNELCISANAVQAHLNHGDRLGSCNTPSAFIFENVTVFPNPTEAVLNVKVDKVYDNAELNVYNILARKVKSEPLTSTMQQISLENLNIGVYFLHIKNGKYYTIKSIVKK